MVCCRRSMKHSFSANNSATALGRWKEDMKFILIYALWNLLYFACGFISHRLQSSRLFLLILCNEVALILLCTVYKYGNRYIKDRHTENLRGWFGSFSASMALFSPLCNSAQLTVLTTKRCNPSLSLSLSSLSTSQEILVVTRAWQER